MSTRADGRRFAIAEYGRHALGGGVHFIVDGVNIEQNLTAMPWNTWA